MTSFQEFPGNVMPQPGYDKDLAYTTDDEIMYSMQGYTQKGVTLAPGQGILLPGTILARKTSNKLWYSYSNTSVGHDGTARGVLRTGVNTGTNPAGRPIQANIVVMGIVKNSKISGADAAAITALGARIDNIQDTFKF